MADDFSKIKSTYEKLNLIAIALRKDKLSKKKNNSDLDSAKLSGILQEYKLSGILHKKYEIL